MKTEIRRPKPEGNPKPEARKPWVGYFGFRFSAFFRTSDFGLRIWALRYSRVAEAVYFDAVFVVACSISQPPPRAL